VDSDGNHVSGEIDSSDSAMGHAVVRGAVVGTVVGFVATTAIALIAGTSFGMALTVAVWPAFVGGPFFGGVVAVGRFMHREEQREAAHERVARAERSSSPAAAPRRVAAA
jgi:hypothetical protein